MFEALASVEIMKLIPFYKFSIEVNSDEETLRSKLEPHVERFWTNGKVLSKTSIFEGELSEKGFKLRKNIRYSNSFLPVFIGRFKQDANHTRIEITARMLILTNVFMAVFLGFMAIGAVTAILSQEITMFISLFMFVSGWLMMCGGFWFEFPRTLEELRRVVE